MLKKIIYNTIKQPDGYSMMEVLVSLAIFLLMTVSLTTIYLNSILAVTLSGNKSAAVFDTQHDLEKAIANPSFQSEGVERKTEFVINIFEREISGTMISAQKVYDKRNGRKINFVTFVPDR